MISKTVVYTRYGQTTVYDAKYIDQELCGWNRRKTVYHRIPVSHIVKTKLTWITDDRWR